MKAAYIAIIALAGTLSASATDFDKVVTDILAHDPAMTANRAELSAESEALKATNNLADPEVEFDYLWASPKSEGNRWGIGVSQSFDWPGLYRARRRANEAHNLVASFTMLDRLLERRLEVTNLLIEIWATSKKESMLHTANDYLDSLATYYRRLYDTREITAIDYSQFKMTRFESECRLDRIQAEQAELTARLQAIAGEDCNPLELIDGYPDEILKPLESYMHAYLTANFRLKSLQHQTVAAAFDAKAAGMQSLPSFKLGFKHEREGEGNFNGITAGVTLPLFSNRHNRAAALASRNMAEALELQARAEARASVEADYALARRYAIRIEEYSGLFDNISDYFNLLRKSQEGGQITFVEMFREFNTMITLAAEFEDIRRDYNLAVARLNRHTLTIPDIY